MSSDSGALIKDLHDAGVDVSDPWDLVNRPVQYPSAIPILIDWLHNIEARVDETSRPKLREALVRALSVPAAHPQAAPVLIEEFRRVEDKTGLGLRWVVGNALSIVADDSFFEEIASLVQDRLYGKGRQMLVLGLGDSADSRAPQVLRSLLDDDTVALHALKAIGKLRPPGLRPDVEKLTSHPSSVLRREAKKVLSKLPT